MSNKIALATIQFRADAKGANVALDSLKASAKDARKTVDEMQDALDRGIKTMKDANGVEFDVAAKFEQASKKAKSFEAAIRELVKGATALETVVNNIRMGEIEKSSRAELKGAINAAQSRLRPIREKSEKGELNEEDLERQRDLKKVITESEKQLNRLDRDTEKVIETLRKGHKVSEAVLNKEQEGLEKILSMIPKGTAEYKQYAAQLKEIRGYVESIQAKELERSSKLLSSPVLGRYSEDDIRKAISAGKELLATYRTGSKEAQALAAQIANAEAHLKTHGVEAARAAQRQAEAAKLLDDKHKLMSDRMSKLSRLSQDALTETQKFWEAQMQGATRGSKAYKEAVANLKAIADEQERLNTKQLQDSASRLNRKNLRTMSESELKVSVAAAKELLAAMKPTDSTFKQLQDSIIRAEEHMQKFGLDAERSAKKAADQLLVMNDRMGNLGKLSNGALEETKRFWQAQMDGAERSSQAYTEAENHIKAIVAEQQSLADKQAEAGARKLTGGNLMTMSERDIRQAIEDAKKYQQTLSASDQKYKDLSVAIADAEEHIKKYGLEAERSARREAEALKKAEKQRMDTDNLMRQQLHQGTALSHSALKAQEQYWQRLIDDPKTAAASLQEYKDRLQEVQGLQRQKVREEGRLALSEFRNNPNLIETASADTLKKYTDQLKAYRDTLPKQANAAIIEEIEGYLVKAGAAAQKAAEQTMALGQAYRIGLQGLNGSFKGTNDQLKQAKKTLEDQLAVTDKGTKRYDQLRRALDGIALEEKRVGNITKEVQAVLDSPKGKSFNELKMAVEQGRAALANMRTETEEDRKKFDELAAKVKEADTQMKQLGSSSKATASSFEKAWSRLKTYISLYVGAAVAMQKFSSTMDDLMELSDKMGEVRKTTGFTADEVGHLSGELKKLDTRTTITGLLDLSVAAGQLGLKTQDDVEGFTIAANKLMVALPEMGKEGATQMLKVALATGEIDKIRRQMEQGLIEGSSATAVAMEKVGSTIDRLRATSAATAPAITDFVKRVGAVGAQSGITIDQVAALGSTVDAIGMRVEMSATALSRMIPAIKNNAFDIAHAIGVTPETLRNLFETGRGMEAILMIFQHIKDAGMDEDSVEQMLGMGNMKEIMKELNQQGARAGIVFAGLSQNVDELRRQLGVANQAYEENIAIQQEYDKMNETTAAKWQRLKNEIEEMFVGDSAQRDLGTFIDLLRDVVDLIVTLKDYLKAFILGFAAWRLGVGGIIWTYLINPLRLAITETYSLGTQIKRVAVTWRTAWKSMDAATKANLVMAIGTAVYYLGKAIWDTCTRVNELTKALAEVDEQEVVALRDLNHLTDGLSKAIPKANGLADKHKALKEETDALRKEVDELKKSTDKSTEAHDKLSKKTAELEQKEKDLKAAEDESNKANKERSSLITEINSKYSTYLGYLLNEETAALQVAQAHRQIVAALKEEMEQKRMNRQQEAINAKYDEKIAGYQADAQDELSKLPADIQRRIMNRFNSVLANITFEIDPKTQKGVFRRAAAEGFGEKVYKEKEGVDNASYASFDLMQPILKELLRQEAIGQKGVSLTEKDLDDYVKDAWGLIGVDAGFWQLSLNSLEKERQTMELRNQSESTQKALHATSVTEADKMNADAYQRITSGLANNQELTTKNIGDLAQQVTIITANLNKYKGELKNADKFIGKDNEVSLENAVNTMFAALTEQQRKQILAAAKKAEKGNAGGGGGVGGGGGTTSPWGSNPPADSTDYATWDVDELVARRNQMDKFKNKLKPDTDIRAVLAEDKALMKALDNGLKADWKSVLDWYNTERKKIQDELKTERFSTNTGHWRDEKEGKGRRNRFKESDYALAELDRYYSKRKEQLEEARIKENMSEELYNRQAELLEQEHLERRSKLRDTFTAGTTKQEKEMVKQFREWWDKLEKDGKLDEVPWATVESEWAKALASDIGRNKLKAQQDLTQIDQITVKHMNAIAKIIDKERPYDGITANLRDNLIKMDLLFADLDKKGVTDPATLMQEQGKRLSFLLNEAEHAYTLTFGQLKERMQKEGFGDWADEIGISEDKKQQLLAQLRSAYDAIQEAIKKEASVIKKQVDILWNDVMPGNSLSMKQGFESVISSLGLEQDRVKRANSLIGAGAASERVADKLAIKQMKVQLAMQTQYYNLIRKTGLERIAQLEAAGKLEDAEHVRKSLNLSLSQEQKKLDEQRVAIANQLEESQNRLYTELKEWSELIASSVQSVMEASNAGNREYYNERAKMNLTGKGGPGAGTYIVIEDEGTSNAKAHYEYLDERAALERQHEIEQQNAQAEAWKKVMDDINMKMSETITDQINAMMQNVAVEQNTDAVMRNTAAIIGLTGAMGGGKSEGGDIFKRNAEGFAIDDAGNMISPVAPVEPTEQTGETPMWKPFWQMTEEEKALGIENMASMFGAYKEIAVSTEAEKAEILAETPGYTPPPTVPLSDEQIETSLEQQRTLYEGIANLSDASASKVLENQQKMQKGEQQTDQKMATSGQGLYAKLTQAANLYGIAYQTMSNDNLSTSQKFQMFALQAAGQSAIAMLTTDFTQKGGQVAGSLPAILAQCLSINPIAGAAIFAVLTALLGGLMGVAASKIAKSKSEISKVTGASASAGRLATGMMTYAKGNVNELTDPDSLTPGRHYNVDGADGKTYRAKYMGKNAKTHITTGPEFHLVGEKGQEAIIDAHTTRNIRLNEPEIWQNIQTLYNGGRLSPVRRRRGRGVPAFADGNLDDFEEITDGMETGSGSGIGADQVMQLQASLDRNSDVLERAMDEGIKAVFDVYNKGGLVDTYDTAKKNLTRHGERY